MKHLIKNILLLMAFGLISAMPATAQPAHSPEAEQLLRFLRDNEGRRMLTATSACVNWNTSEALWLNSQTGQWPVINSFDFIHSVYSSPGGWIDYSDPQVALDWHARGGIVAAMWHWGQKTNDGTDWTCTPGTEAGQTAFSPACVDDTSSVGYKKIIADIDQVSSWLRPLADAGIPVLWRPLHEAQGNWMESNPGNDWHKAWFWWGIDGPETFVKLWRLMYDRMVNHHELTNLIWVFTAGNSKRWYPGDGYVDIVGADLYDRDMTAMRGWYNLLGSHYPGKLRAITECGNIPRVSELWADGQHWSYFMPWYDWSITNNIHDTDNFSRKDHGCCTVDWWNDALGCDFIVTRDEMSVLLGLPRVIMSGHVPQPSGRAWDSSGRRVGGSYHGIVIQEGRKILIRKQ